MPTPNPLRSYARFVAGLEGTDPDIFERRVTQESSWKPRARSTAGARGLSQFMPGTGARYGLKAPEDFYDPFKSLDAGARHQADLDKEFGGDPIATSVAYNAGPKRVQTYRMRGTKALPTETQNYIRKIHGTNGNGDKARTPERPNEQGRLDSFLKALEEPPGPTLTTSQESGPLLLSLQFHQLSRALSKLGHRPRA